MPQRVYLHVNLFNALTTGALTSGAVDCRTYNYLTFFQRGAGTISGGAVVIEEAPTEDYAGTWSTITATVTPADVSGTAVTKATHVTAACYGWVRARLSTQVSGGGAWTLDLIAN